MTKNNLPERTIGTLCRVHHPQYRNDSFLPASMINAASTTTAAASVTTTAASVTTTAFIGTPTATAIPTTDVFGTMAISTVPVELRDKSPVTSTANKVNGTTATKRRMKRNGDIILAVKGKEMRIGKNVRVYSTKAQLKSRVKQGDPQHDVISAVGDGFRFYGKVIEPDARKGWWVVEFDLFPTSDKRIRITRGLVTTVRAGEDEPSHHPRHDKVAEAVANIERLADLDEESCDILLDDSDDDGDDSNKEMEDSNINISPPKTTKKRKLSKKVSSIQSFLNMSDDLVLDATTFNHFYGEGNADFIPWTILEEGKEIVQDVMQHPTTSSVFNIDIPWSPSINGNDYFTIFFEHFFPSLEGKAAVIDKYLSDERCSAYTYVKHDKIIFHRPDESDPDYLVSFPCLYWFLLCN